MGGCKVLTQYVGLDVESRHWRSAHSISYRGLVVESRTGRLNEQSRPVYSLLGLLPHKYIHQTTQKTLTTARSHTHTHTHYVCVHVYVCVCVCVCIFIQKCLSILYHTNQLYLSPSHSHTQKRHSVCLFPALSVPGAVLNTPPLFYFEFPRVLVSNGPFDRRRYRVIFLYWKHENAWLWWLPAVEVGAGWQSGPRE